MGAGVLTAPFPRVEGELRAGVFRLSELAARFGTPLYVYDLEQVEARFHAFDHAFREVEHLIAYSVKANGNLAVLHRLGRLGAGADIVSLGEPIPGAARGHPPGADRVRRRREDRAGDCARLSRAASTSSTSRAGANWSGWPRSPR